MTKRELYQCDNCGYVQNDDYAEGIFQCHICNEDFCEECKDEHAQQECFG